MSNWRCNQRLGDLSTVRSFSSDGRTNLVCSVTKRVAEWSEYQDERSRVPSGRVGVLGQASLSAYGVKPVG
jgi:hypothetical protein